MVSFGISIAVSPIVRFWRTVRSVTGARLDAEPIDFVSYLSYEEAECKHNEAVMRLVQLLRQQSDVNSEQARAHLDSAVQYASRMNELCGGPHDVEFKQNLRRQLLLDCIAAAGSREWEDEAI